MVKKIALDNLKIDEMNSRKVGWITDEKLVQSIKKMGIINPLIVRPHDGEYGIVCGSRRYNAAIEAGLEKVPCKVKEMTDLEAKMTSLHENLERENLSKMETAENIKETWKMLDGEKSYEEKIEYLEEKFGIGEKQINRYRDISKLVDKVEVIGELLKPVEQRDKKKLKDIGFTDLKSVELDTNTAAMIQTKYGDKSKEELIKIAKLTAPKDQDEAKIMLNEFYPKTRHLTVEEIEKGWKKYKDMESAQRKKEFTNFLEMKEDKSIEEIYKDAMNIPLSQRIQTNVDPRTYKSITMAMNDYNLSRGDLIEKAVKDWLREEGYLDA